MATPFVGGKSMKVKENLVRWIRHKLCRHQFDLDNLELTGIKEVEQPSSKVSYKEMEKWYNNRSTKDAFIKRVKWPCAKCGKVFFAHCDLDVLSKYGTILPHTKKV